MSNQPFHNKWHGFNHFTLPLSDYPDSATDPIAGINHPFLGIFHNNIPSVDENTIKQIYIEAGGINYQNPVTVSYSPADGQSIIVEEPIINFNIDTSTRTISSADVIYGGRFVGKIAIIINANPLDPGVVSATFTLTAVPFTLTSNSNYWAYNYNLTRTYSADWSLFPSVCTNATSLCSNWWSGYLGYTTLQDNSAYYESYFTTTSSLSNEKNYTGKGGDGWHIALSSITWKTNVSAVNTHQKVALPYQLVESTARTYTWNTTAQTAYINLTGDYTAAVDSVLNQSKGGKYTLWVFIDKCPGDTTQLVFNPSVFNLKVKTDTVEYDADSTNAISLSRNTISKIDFVFDGQKMLGRSTFYFLDAKTTDDIYYQGTGITMRDGVTRRQRASVFVNGPGNVTTDRYITVANRQLKSGQGWRPSYTLDTDNITPVSRNRSTLQRFSSAGMYISFVEIDPVSSLYVSGSGITIKLLESNMYYFNFQIFGSNWQTSATINNFAYLSASFDRIVGALSGSSNWQDPQYADNLIVSPMRSSAPSQINGALPVEKYTLATSNILPVSACTRYYYLSVISGKDKIIDNISVNKTIITKSPIVFNNRPQQYNFLNEETTSLVFEKIQNDTDIVVNFKFQPGRFLKNNYFWLNPGDNTLIRNTILPDPINTVRHLAGRFYSNTPNNVTQYVIAPFVGNEIVNPSTAPQLVLSGSHRFLRFTPSRTATSSFGLTALSGNTFFNDFTVFTVFRPIARPSSNSIIWWIGDYTRASNSSNMGYGLVLGNDLKIYTKNNSANPVAITKELELNKTYILTNIISNKNNQKQEAAFLDGIPILRNTRITGNTPLQDTKLYFNYHPQLNSGNAIGSFQLYDYYIFNRSLPAGETRRMNLFLIDKISKY